MIGLSARNSADCLDLAIVESLTSGMTIEGIDVADRMAAYRSAKPTGMTSIDWVREPTTTALNAVPKSGL
jgi:hypothetical protein